MRLILVLFMTIFWSAASAAHAGAWLREKGTGFVSLSFGASMFSETTNSLYLEYGLSEKITVGLDISAFTNAQDVRNGFGNLFMRRSLGPTDGRNKWAYEIGVGGLWGNEMQRPTIKTGLSWGRGFQVNKHSGWINLDAAVIYEPTLNEHIVKFDGTVGLDFGNITTGIVEVALSQQENEFFGAIEPSILIRPKQSRFQVKVGAQIPFDDQKKSAFKLGVWHTF